MDTVREGEHFVPDQDVLILGAHSDTQLYYWNVDTGSLMGTLSTEGHPDVEGVVVCKDD
jgi:WD40 repeat protein